MNAHTFKSPLLVDLQQRGHIHQCSDPETLDRLAASPPITAYIGFDCTAPSLHVGNLLGVMLLRRLQQHGHIPIVLLGGGTSRVGDPSGKTETRQLLSNDDINTNKRSIKRVFSIFLHNNPPNPVVFSDNAQWLNSLKYLNFLRSYGRHFSVNRMIAMESVKTRLDSNQNLSFLEFNYMALQAYDFVELHRRHQCSLQMGGSDQWGNIIQGVELARRLGEGPLFALTGPLLTTASGAKMGKTADGAVWLDPKMLSSYQYHQFWRNTRDEDVAKFLRLFTHLTPLEAENLAKHDVNNAKNELAFLCTSLAHGKNAALKAKRSADALFSNNPQQELALAAPSHPADVKTGVGLLNALRLVKLAASNAEARRLVRQNGVRVNSSPVSDETLILNSSHLQNGAVLLSVGKKRHARLVQSNLPVLIRSLPVTLTLIPPSLRPLLRRPVRKLKQSSQKTRRQR